MINIIRSIINFFGFNDAIVDGIGERGMRDSSIIRYNEIHDMYDKIIKDLGDVSAYVSKGYIYDKIKERTGLSTRHISRILNHTKKKDLRFVWHIYRRSPREPETVMSGKSQCDGVRLPQNMES